MQQKFLNVDILGTLYLNEVYYFYDEPQLFLSRGKTGQKYLSILTNMDRREWLLSPISDAMLSLLKANRIPCRDIYTNPEDGFVWKLKHDINSNIAIARQISPDKLDETDLPDADLFLDYEFDEYMPVIEDDIIDLSKKECRDIIDISLEINKSHAREISSEVLGGVLTDTQQVLYSLAYRNESIKGRIPNIIKEKNSLYVTGTRAASFGVRFKSYDLCNLMGETEITETISEFSKLLETNNDEERLKTYLNSQTKRTVIKYRNLMKTLLQANAGLKIKGASPNQKYFNVEFSTNDVLANLKILDGEINDMVSIETMFGDIVGINVEKKTFAFKSVDGEHITGKICNSFTDTIFEVPKTAEITVEQKLYINDLTGEEKNLYTLLELKDVVPTNNDNADGE